jgi:restriction system protein
LVIEYDLPTMDVIPKESGFKYVKARDQITSSSWPAKERKSLYSSLIAQVTLRTIHEVFEADRGRFVDTVVFNGHVDVIDQATGRGIRPCLVTIRTVRDVLESIDLSRVSPQLCLKHLNAAVSQNPSELAPVRPILEFNMVDPRFVEEVDVMSSLDRRPNLMELSPTEFESLITNLFLKMGLEARTTRASRDGGVDCVAWDPRPIFGGKVIIQAKRYKNKVGVSAVRDLYGTLHNEGASKGILVTTSGYGKAAYEFSQNKPLELLDGSNLRYLLSQHSQVEARIKGDEKTDLPGRKSTSLVECLACFLRGADSAA